MDEIDKLDRYRVAYTLLEKLKEAEEEAEKEGYILAVDVEKELDLNEWITFNAKYCQEMTSYAIIRHGTPLI